ncbi:dephospho-CoA kinase [Nigerium sp.]|uniref:dephospho-CoA kinase n=1 Tax=Nigerium sp. TaxID=2042655 RepID=UPI00322179B0
MTRRIGLTGGIASGKTAVSDMLARRGAVIIDSDTLAREVVEPGTRGLEAIVERFATTVLTPDGALDRAKLGQIVFDDPVARADLNAIVHPAVRARAAELQLQAPPGAVVVQVIPLLVETGQADDFDLVVVVDADEAVQLRRLMQRNGYTPSQARARLKAQASRAERLEAADLVIDNSAGLPELEAQVDALWPRLAGEPRS